MQRTTKYVLGLIAVTVLALTGGCAVDTSSGDHPFSAKGNGKQAKKDVKDVKADDKPQADKGPNLTTAQEQAIISAQGYLDMDGMSRKGLIDQLKFERFSTEDATFAVDHIKVNWNEQAVRSAKGYLEMGGMSQPDLVGQLKFEGFTPDQAVYGARIAYNS